MLKLVTEKLAQGDNRPEPTGSRKADSAVADKPSGASCDSEMHSGGICLAMLLKLHKVAADPALIQRNFAPSGIFVPVTLVRAARKLGLKAKLLSAKSTDLSTYALPAILQDHSGEFFILARADREKVLIQRPGQPPETLTLSELEECWSGALILATNKGSGTQTRFGLSWFGKTIFKYRHLIGEVLVVSFFLQVMGLITPLFFQVVMDKVLVHRGLSTLDVISIGLLAVSVFEVLLGGLRTYVFSHTTSKIDVELGVELFRHMLHLPLRYFETRPVGQTVARMRELEKVREFLTSSAVTVLIDTMFTVVFFVAMYFYSPVLFWVSFASVPLLILISIVVTPPLRRKLDVVFQKGAENQSFLTESVSGIETLKTLSVEPGMQERWEGQLAGYVKASFQTTILGASGAQAVQLVTKLVTVGILWLGARQVIEGQLTVGQLVAFNMMANQVNGPIIRLSQLWQDFQQMRVSLERIGEIMAVPAEIEPKANRSTLPTIKGEIRFQGISFRYQPDRPEAVRDLSFTIRPGEMIGLVGRSGSGKSTITKLLQRLYVPERGKILVDGMDTAVADPAWLRSRVGVVLQENVMFRASVRDNIAMANPSLSIDKVIEAAKCAGAHDFILELKDGYDTLLEERGANLSGGQRQRLAIARALAVAPPILIFDEATSALDYESERIIQQNMNRIRSNRTMLVVAHRLSTVMQADRIFVMDEGRIVESGNHSELIHANGVYAGLHDLQSGTSQNEA